MSMEKNLYLDFKPHDPEISDAVSTSAASLACNPFDENSPLNAHSTPSVDNDVLSQSKKIRKKRNAYKKIDDNIRLGLLEAVQNGETLKSAAKRYQVNYSSAKSIFHIYRKEGRILKKATTEKGFTSDFQIQPEVQMSQMPPQYLTNYNPQNFQPMFPSISNMNFCQQMQPQPQPQIQPQEFRPERLPINSMDEGSGCSSPLNGLVDNFSEVLKIGNGMKAKDDTLKAKTYAPIHPSRFNPNMSPTNYAVPKMQPNQQMSFACKPIVSHGQSPAERAKHLDNFYMNYSNSPLSGNAKMMREGSESGSSRYVQGEFESFTEMVSAFQNQKNQGQLPGSLKDMSIPKLIGPERKGSLDDELAWNGTIETAALDTFKSFIDAQMVLSNAFRKASYLNNLVQLQKVKTDGSPKFLSFQGN